MKKKRFFWYIKSYPDGALRSMRDGPSWTFFLLLGSATYLNYYGTSF